MNIDELIITTKQVVSRRLACFLPSSEPNSEEHKAELAEFMALHELISRLQYDIVLTAGLHIPTLEDMYRDHIAVDSELENILFATIGELRLRYGLTGRVWEELCATVGEVLFMGISTGVTESSPEKTFLVTPVDFVDKLTNKHDNKKVLMANPWLMVIVLLSMSDPVLVPLTSNSKMRKSS